MIEIFARAAAYASIQPVERAVLEDLVKIGITAPSGTNSQSWTFTINGTKYTGNTV